MKRFLFFNIILLSFLLFACSDDPNSVGVKMLPIQDSLSLRAFSAPSGSTMNFLSRIAGTSSIQLFGGTDTIKTRSLMQFSGLPTNLSAFEIDTAFLRFPVSYRFHDSTGIFGIKIHQILRSWVKDSVRWDTTNVASFVNISSADERYDTTISKNDSVMQIPINSVVRKWMQDSLVSPYGILISPDANCNIILGCPAAYSIIYDDRPELYIVYRTGTDTVRLSYRPFQQAYVADGVLPSTGDSILYLQGGLTYRGKLQFDLSRIPRYASITQASLQLTLDPAHTSRNSYSYNTVTAHLALDNGVIPSLSTLSSSATFSSDTVYTLKLDMRSLVQQGKANSLNYGFVLRSGGEFVGVDRLAFFTATAADSTKRPQLKITYTILP